MRGRAVIVPIVMILVAVVQVMRVLAFNQSSWQGAGFGMFATYDFDGTRGVVAAAVVEGEAVQLPLDDVTPDLYRRARVVPTDDVLREMVAALRPVAPAGFTAIVVEVRGPAMEDGQVRYRVINRVVIDG